MDEKNINTTQISAEEEYTRDFMPKVHKIGRITMIIAFLLSFLPVGYFIVVRGYGLSFSQYATVAISICGLGIGMWIAEPVAYWPVLGSAGTYISYLSGNVGAMRVPVAVSVQSNMDADINTPRGQVITIVGIVSSVVANLILLMIIVLGGEWLINVLPENVMGAFSFVIITLLGALWMMRFDGKNGVVKGFLEYLPYIIVVVVLYYAVNAIGGQLTEFGMLIAVIACIAFAYAIYKRDLKKLECEEGK